MSDPIRWRDNPPDAPARAAKLLAAGVAPRAMFPAERAAVMRAAAHVAGRGSVVAGSGAALWKGALAGFLGSAALLAAAAVVAPMLRSQIAAPRTQTHAPAPHGIEVSRGAVRMTPVIVPAATRLAPPPPVPQAVPRIARVQSHPPAPGSEHVRAALPGVETDAPPSQPLDPLQQEYAILLRAQSHLDADPNATLADLAAHASHFPSGQLASERECIAIEALDRLGRRADATARIRNVIAQFASSPCAQRMRHRLAADDLHSTQESNP